MQHRLSFIMRECFSNLHAVSNYLELTILAIYDTCVILITTACQSDFVSGHVLFVYKHEKDHEWSLETKTHLKYLKFCFLSSQKN